MNLLRRFATAALVALMFASLAVPNGRATPMSAMLLGYDLVQVGDSGNAADSNPHVGRNGYGSVDYEFRIGKNNVTIGQYAEFLNAVAKSDPRGLWNSSMDSDQRFRGIARSGNDGAYVYTVVGPNGTNPVGAQSAANRPVTNVSWFDAARFANWMANGKPTGAAGPATTDNGAYNLGTATSGNAVAKNAINPNTGDAPTFYIPTENEWYKAAYYSPVKGGPGSPGYYAYATQSDSAPGNGWDGTTALANKDLANQANYRTRRRYAVTGMTTLVDSSSNQNVLTDVGAFTNSASYYGAFDMSGNVMEWHDPTDAADSSRWLRGGDLNCDTFNLSSSFKFPFAPSYEDGYIGFRLASPVAVP
jgi:sulfatase modifying factor 1